MYRAKTFSKQKFENLMSIEFIFRLLNGQHQLLFTSNRLKIIEVTNLILFLLKTVVWTTNCGVIVPTIPALTDLVALNQV